MVSAFRADEADGIDMIDKVMAPGIDHDRVLRSQLGTGGLEINFPCRMP